MVDIVGGIGTLNSQINLEKSPVDDARHVHPADVRGVCRVLVDHRLLRDQLAAAAGDIVEWQSYRRAPAILHKVIDLDFVELLATV